MTPRQRNRTRARVSTAIRQASREHLPDVARTRAKAPEIHWKHLNWGWCEDVAQGALERLARWGVGSTVICDDDLLRVPWFDESRGFFTVPPGHWWLYVPALGTHHDCEAPRGVECWTRLPLFLRSVRLGARVTKTSTTGRQRNAIEQEEAGCTSLALVDLIQAGHLPGKPWATLNLAIACAEAMAGGQEPDATGGAAAG